MTTRITIDPVHVGIKVEIAEGDGEDRKVTTTVLEVGGPVAEYWLYADRAITFSEAPPVFMGLDLGQADGDMTVIGFIKDGEFVKPPFETEDG